MKKVLNQILSAKLKAVFKNIDCKINSVDYLNIVGSEATREILDLLKLKIDKTIHKHLFLAYYKKYSNLHSECLIESFKIIESILKAKIKQNADKYESYQIFSRAKNEEIITKREYNYISALRDVRNKITHNFEDCTPEEANLSIKIAVDLLKK